MNNENIVPDDVFDFGMILDPDFSGLGNDDPIIDDIDNPVPTPEPEDPSDDDSDEDETDYKDIYNLLKSQNILVDDEEPEKVDLKTIAESLNKTKTSLRAEAAQSLISSLPPSFHAIAEYAMAGGKHIDEFYARQTKVSALEEVDLDNVSTQKEILRDYYKKTGNYSDVKIDKLISSLELSESLADEAEEAYEELKGIYKAAQDNLLKDEEAAAKQYRESITQAVEKLPSIPDDRKNKLKAFMINPVTRDGITTTDFTRALNTISSNYDHLAQLADIISEYDPKTGFDFGRFTSKGKSVALEDLKSKLGEVSSVKAKVGGSSNPTQAQKSID